MSDSVEEKDNILKAGHPPAVKVSGGVRITQHNKPIHEKPVPKNDNDEEEDGEEQVVDSGSPPKPLITSISGAPVRSLNEDYPASSIKAYHERQPMPTHENRPMNNKAKQFIHQPKK